VNPFNALLIILAIISIATGDKATFSVMMSMVVASTGLRSVSRLLPLKKIVFG
jgi:P-type Mg2+ transporter